jgi:myo-inositol-1(or 4)-monophosphatase
MRSARATTAPRADARFELAIEAVRQAGAILLNYFGSIRDVRQKEHPSSVVCEADLASEKLVIQRIRKRFPDDGIIAEESGWVPGNSGFTWVIDPLDGTSNFVAGIPWFGVQIGVLHGSRALAAAMYLPVTRTLYASRLGHGTLKDGRRVQVTREPDLKETLCAFGFDATAAAPQTLRNARLLMRVAKGVRNTRATNSLVDFCYTIDGRLGGCINLNCKVWDIAPVSLMLPEAGGKFTALNGTPIEFAPDEQILGRTFRILGASKTLHPKLVALANP